MLVGQPIRPPSTAARPALVQFLVPSRPLLPCRLPDLPTLHLRIRCGIVQCGGEDVGRRLIVLRMGGQILPHVVHRANCEALIAQIDNRAIEHERTGSPVRRRRFPHRIQHLVSLGHVVSLHQKHGLRQRIVDAGGVPRDRSGRGSCCSSSSDRPGRSSFRRIGCVVAAGSGSIGSKRVGHCGRGCEPCISFSFACSSASFCRNAGRVSRSRRCISICIKP